MGELRTWKGAGVLTTRGMEALSDWTRAERSMMEEKLKRSRRKGLVSKGDKERDGGEEEETE